MSGRRKKAIKRAYLVRDDAGTWRTPDISFRKFKKDYLNPPPVRATPQPEGIPTVDARDKSKWAHGKMKRAGYYATRKRS